MAFGSSQKEWGEMLPQSILKLIYKFIHTMKPVRIRFGIGEKLVFHRNFYDPKIIA
jgi:hypothetical protein